ncbi:MAG: DinB family protein [Actinobacteria bacterium]|nr:DinB family protein [Actinomycetota bacterium]
MDLGCAVTIDDYLWFVDHTLDEMIAILEDLGDERANIRPDLPGANSPYVILTHCLGVMEDWGGRMIAGREITRDRPAEFTASGPVAELVDRTRAARLQLATDIVAVAAGAPPRAEPTPGVVDLPYGRTQGGVMLHIYEELSQHLGHMELTRDIIRAI